MASEEQIPGEVISLGDSEEDSTLSKKHAIDDEPNAADSASADAPSHISKRAKLSRSRSSLSSAASKGSEEGEVDESFTKSESGQVDGKRRSGSFVPSNPHVFRSETFTAPLRLPTLSREKENSWVERVTDWTRVLCESNGDFRKEITPGSVVSAFTQYVDVHSGLKPPKKRTAKMTVRSMDESGKLATIIADTKPADSNDMEDGEVEGSPEYEPSEQPPALDAATEEAASQPQSSAQNGEIRPTTNGAATEEITQPLAVQPTEEQRRYFPSATDASRMCLSCGHEGHAADACRYNKCRFCGETGHWDFTCQSIPVRCDKCRQLGHKAATCVEKLALTKDEGLACAYCGLADHLESECTEPWRSFHPGSETVRMVSSISSSCAVCGSRNHFASDCSQRGDNPHNPTWTLRNRNLYVDPNCDELTIEEAVGQYGGQKKPLRENAKIPGHASRTMNVHYSESDDSELEFLGNWPVKKKTPKVGQIRMSSNIQLNGTQPPLPPGPPPPLPPPQPSRAPGYPPPPGVSNYRSSQPSNAPPSLPPKPPASSRGRPPPPPRESRNNDRGRGNGRPPRSRGGRGGRGRGRGRGGR